MNELREWYKEHGICTICHHENALNGRTYCIVCKARVITYNQDNWMKQGICYTCGKSPCLKGKKICQSCYDKSLKSLEKARTFIKSGWRFEDFKFGKYDKPERNEQE